MQAERVASRSWPLALASALAAVCASAFVVVYQFTVRTTPGRLLGDASLRGAKLTNSHVGEVVNSVLNVVSAATLLAAVAVILLVALLRLRRVQGLAAIVLLAGANGSSRLLKDFVLIRPDLGLREVTPATLNSLPSGHSTAIFSVVAALLYVLPAPWRVVAAVIGTAGASVTAVATMSAGWHRAGDSLAAFLLVGVWAAFAAAAVVLFGEGEAGVTCAPRKAQRFVRWLAVAAAGVLTLGATLEFALLADESIRQSSAGPAAAFLAGGLLIAGTATAVLAAILMLLNRIVPTSG